MALILQIESSTEVCSVAIADSGTTLSYSETFEPNSHTEKLTILIENCLSDAGFSIKQLDAVCISHGPGSYTSLRVGASVAKGICYALNIPLMAVDSLLILCHGIDDVHLHSGDIIIPMIDARRMEVYSAIFDAQRSRIAPTEAVLLEEDIFKQYKLQHNILHVCGNGAKKYYETHFSEKIIPHHAHTSAQFMSVIANEIYKKQQFQNLAYYIPNYLKSPNITKSLKKL